MSTATYNMNAPELAIRALENAAAKLNTATETMTRTTRLALMIVGAPLLGLAFVMAMPVICVALTVYYSAKLAAARWSTAARYVKNVALFFAAPFVGLAYLLALPLVGFGTLVYFGVKAARR